VDSAAFDATDDYLQDEGDVGYKLVACPKRPTDAMLSQIPETGS
jgi:hypothetical protein